MEYYQLQRVTENSAKRDNSKQVLHDLQEILAKYNLEKVG